jgi:exodeoxyribonuclease VII large subunit
MAKQSKSQWDFGGELFPTQEMRRVFSVTEVTATVRRLLEERVGTVWVTGEISNLRAQSSGHIYFSLKDANAQLACVCFRDDARSTRALLQDGRKVVLKGDVTVYEARGQYQLIVTSVELEGIGALQVAFEKLKEKLAAEGLFAAERKRPIPELVHRIGLVTSPTGAAIRDVLHVIERRHPGLEIILAPCRVQGQGAADQIVCSIALLNEWADRGQGLDVILVTRGGGSLEDLWAFNEESVARAIFHSRVPVVSAVGHEIDFTISDFVADLRAATPSAAAELLTEGMLRRREWVAQSLAHLFEITRERVQTEREHFQWLASRLARAHPRRQLNEHRQRLDELQTSLARCTRKELRRHQTAVSNFAQRLARVKPSRTLGLRRQIIGELMRRLQESARHALQSQRQQLREMETRLRLLSPEQVLERGFSITRDAATGAVIRDADAVKPRQKLKTRLQRGEILSTAEDGGRRGLSRPKS